MVTSRMKDLIPKTGSMRAKWQIGGGKAALYDVRSLYALLAWVLNFTH